MVMLLFGALGVFTVACSSGDRPTVTGDPLPTAEPAPTVAGVVIKTNDAAVAAQAVVVGANVDWLIEVRAQPGLEMPLVGEVTAGAPLQPIGELFTTEDGLLWWRVRAAGLQGWTAARLAYRGPATVITDAIQSISSNETFVSEEAAAAAVTAQVAAERGSAEVTFVSRTEVSGQNSVTITNDIVLNDSAVAGVRVSVAMAADDDAWRPVAVTQFELCSRGVNAEGNCL